MQNNICDQRHFQYLLSNYNHHIELQNEDGTFIQEAAISYDFTFLATTHIQKSKILIIWNLQLKKKVKQAELKYQRGKMILFYFSKSSQQFYYSQKDDNSVTIVDIQSPDLKSKTFVIEEQLKLIRITQDELYGCSVSLLSNNCYFWHLGNGEYIKQFSHQDPICMIQYYNNDKRLITIQCCYDFTQFSVWDVKKSIVIKQWKQKIFNFNCDILLNEKQDLLIVYFRDEDISLIQIWSLISYKQIRTLYGLDDCMIIKNIFGNLIIAESEEETDDDNEGKLIADIFDIVSYTTQNVVTFLQQGEEIIILRNAVIAGKRQKQKMSSFSVYI